MNDKLEDELEQVISAMRTDLIRAGVPFNAANRIASGFRPIFVKIREDSLREFAIGHETGVEHACLFLEAVANKGVEPKLLNDLAAKLRSSKVDRKEIVNKYVK